MLGIMCLGSLLHLMIGPFRGQSMPTQPLLPETATACLQLSTDMPVCCLVSRCVSLSVAYPMEAISQARIDC